MIQFLARLQKIAQEQGELIAFLDEDGKRQTTYAQINEASSRVAAWLRKKKLGREDVVAILLPRGTEYFITELAVFKAGACFIPLDSHQASERRAYILHDSKAKLIMTMEEYTEAVKCEPLTVWADAAEHDLAFIIYTSGSTGNPKGVLQEYGTLDTLIKLTADIFNFAKYRDCSQSQFRFALVTPFIFVATMDIVVVSLWEAATVCIISEELLRNFTGLLHYFSQYQIHGTFMSMSLYKHVPLNLKLPLKIVALGSEPVAEVYNTQFTLLNCYSMSELVIVLAFPIDQCYKVTPVGKPYAFLETRLLDENGRVTTKEGILCLRLPYFRGYLNLPEKTAAAFTQIEGKRFFITGDLVRSNQAGNLVVLGRADDMIKINGNRVEPGEVEGALLRVFPQLRQVAVRGFTDKNGFNYLCAYYLADTTISSEEFRTKLRKEITAYMFPRYYIHLDHFPLTVTGKVAKRQLPEPQSESYRAAYVPPADELEKVLCDGFASTLEKNQVSAADDFYLLGGDSLATMTLLTSLPIEGITFKEIVEGRTPQKIAQLCRKRHMTVKLGTAKTRPRVRHADYPVLTMQRGILDLQLVNAKSTSWNLGGLYRLDPALDFPRLVKALETVLQHFAIFGTQFFIDEETIELRQRFLPQRPPLTIEHLSLEEFAQKKAELKQPFHLFNNFMYRARAFSTPDGNYLFLDLHHTIVDGTSISIFFHSLAKVYAGQKLPEADYDFQDVLEQEFYTAVLDKPSAAAAGLQKELTALDIANYLPVPDHNTQQDEEGELFLPLPNLSKSYFTGKNYGGNVFFMVVALLAQAKLLHREDAFLVWTYNGRNTALKARIVGPMLHDNPMYVKLPAELTAEALLQKVNAIVQGQLEVLPALEAIVDTSIDGNCMGFLYQQELHSEPVLDGKRLTAVALPDPLCATNDVFDIEIWEKGEGFLLYLDYNAGLYAQETAVSFGSEFKQIVAKILANPQVTLGELR